MKGKNVQRWLCITTRINAEITEKKLIWGVKRRFRNTIFKVKEGDTLLMYTIQDNVNRIGKPPAIMGTYEVISNVYEDENLLFETPKSFGDEKFPLRVKLKPIKIFQAPHPFKPLIANLSFIKNKKNWTGVLRTAMRLISEEDYHLIINSEKQ